MSDVVMLECLVVIKYGAINSYFLVVDALFSSQLIIIALYCAIINNKDR
jgi:hypothetical protein